MQLTARHRICFNHWYSHDVNLVTTKPDIIVLRGT